MSTVSSGSKRSAKMRKTNRAKGTGKEPPSGVTSKKTSTARSGLPRWLVILLLGLIVCAAEAIRFRLIDLPLERDEGEYAYAGQLMLQGIPPYKLAYNMKLPGTYAAYAVIMAVFGQTIRGIHLGLIVVNGITIVLIYFLGRRLFGQICGLTAAGCYALMTLSDSVLGLAAHATHFVVVFAVAGMLLLLRTLKSGRILSVFWSGLLFGLAFVMKQPGVFFGIFGGLVILWHELRRSPLLIRHSVARLSMFSVGVLLPITIVVSLVSAAGVFQPFWFWVVNYAREYVVNPTGSYGWEAFKPNVLRILAAGGGIWILALAGVVVSLIRNNTRSAGLFGLAFLIASFATVCPGFYFRRHYFITVLPALALFAGAALEAIWQALSASWSGNVRRTSVLIVVLVIALGPTVYLGESQFFRLSPDQVSRALYSANPFPESVEVGNYIREHSTPDARVAVIGSEPQIYFYSGRHSATGYIYMYPLMERQKYAAEMQQQAIREIEEAKPEFVVFVAVPWSWMQRSTSNIEILTWVEKYLQTDFEEVGLADIQANDRTVYRWGTQAVAAVPRSEYYVQVFKRLDYSY